MSPELKDYYCTKQRRKAFYILENELHNKENPPDISAVIGLDKDLEISFYSARRTMINNPGMKMGMHLGIRINRDTNKTEKKENEKFVKKDNEIVRKKTTKNNDFHCPSLPTQWKNNFEIIIPRAEFA